MFTIAYDSIYAHPLPEAHRFPMLKYELIPGQLLHEGVITEANLFSPEPLAEDIILANTYFRLLAPHEKGRTDGKGNAGNRFSAKPAISGS